MIDYKKSERWFKRERKQLGEYVQAQATMAAWHRGRMTEYVEGKQMIGHATVALGFLAGYRGAVGSARVLDGDESGFAELDIACLYNYWALRLLVGAYEADTRPGKQPRVMMENVATAFMHAEALGATTMRDWLADRVRRTDGGDPALSGKDMNPLCTLMAHFATGHDAAALAQSGWAPIGPYAPVVTRTLAPADYDALAVYHEQSVDGADYPPFHFLPYRVAPFELQAIEKRTGVAMSGKHPLITSPLAKRREVPEIPMTDELQAVLDRAKTEFSL